MDPFREGVAMMESLYLTGHGTQGVRGSNDGIIFSNGGIL